MKPIVSTQNLSHQYHSQTQALVFPDLAVQAGHSLLVLGESGAGKTTLLHLLCGLLLPTSGQVIINDTNLATLTHRKRDAFRGRQIGLALQQSHFVQSLTVLENLLLAYRLSGHNQKQGHNHILQKLEEAGLADYVNKKPAQLSQGQQQRVSVIRAVQHKPALLLADEPTSALDDQNAERVGKLLLEEAGKGASTVIVVTHDKRLIDLFDNKTLILSS